MKLPALTPVLVVDNINEAIRFYCKLGFTEEKEYTFADDGGEIVHAQLRVRNSILFLGRRGVAYDEGYRAAKVTNAAPSERGLGVTLILQTDDLENVLKVVEGEKLELLYGPADEWYGDRIFLFVDPFGYEWKVSQPSVADRAGTGQ